MIPLLILTPLIVLAAVGAVWRARPVHAALFLALALTLQGALYLMLAAEFVGLAQFMVYVGGVAVLIVFALLITRPGDEREELERRPLSFATGVACVAPLLAMLMYVIWRGQFTAMEAALEPGVPLEELGENMFSAGLPAVLALGALLTAVLLGSALLARELSRSPKPQPRHTLQRK